MKNFIAAKILSFFLSFLVLAWCLASFRVYLQFPSQAQLKKAASEIHQAGLDVELNAPVVSELRAMIFFPWKYQQFSCGMNRSHSYKKMILEELHSSGVPEPFATLPLIESGYRNDANGLNGGIWHSNTYTARVSGLTISKGTDERLEPMKDTEFSLKVLSTFYHYFKSWPLALIAYREGASFVTENISKSGSKNPWDVAQDNVVATRYLAQFMANALLRESAQKSEMDSKQLLADPWLCDWF